MAAGREGRLLINAGAEARRGARTRAPHGWHFREAGCALQGPGRLKKALPPRRTAGKGDIAAELSSGLAQDRSHALGDTVTLAGMQNGETIKAHGSAPLQYLKSLLIGVPMHTDFCQRESPQPQTSGYFLPAVGLQVC